MSKRNICPSVTMFLLGMSWRIFHSRVCLIVGIFLLAILLWHIQTRGRMHLARGSLVLTAVLLLFGVLRGESSRRQCEQIQSFLQRTDQAAFQGELYKKEITSDKTVYYLQHVYLQRDGEQIKIPSVILYPESDCDSIGTIYMGKARVLCFSQSRNEGNFDEQNYYLGNEIFAKLTNPQIEKRIPAKLVWRQKLFDLRCRLQGVYQAYLPGEESGVMAALTLGDKADLKAEAKELYRIAGLSHILAISGLHISVVGMGVYRLLRKVGMRYWSSGIVSSAVVFLYASMCGMGITIKRAILMYFLLLFGNALGRAYDSLTALAVVAFFLFGTHPMYLYNTGGIFSFLAVFGVVTMGKRCKTLGMTLGMQLFLLPLLSYFYYEIPLYSGFLNILLLPLVGVLLGLGLSGAFAGMLHPAMARAMLLPCHMILYVFEWLADMSLKLPGARQIIGCPSLWKICIYYVALFFAFYGVKSKPKRLLVLVLAVTCLCVRPSRFFEMNVLDVGQGDGIFIQSEGGTTFFIDGGSTDVASVGKYRILPFLKYRGIRGVDYWFVSHADEDHVNGLLECLRDGYSIRYLVFSSYVVQNENYHALVAEANRQGVNILYMKPQMQCGTDRITFTCLYPEQMQGDDTNAMSLVLLMETKEMRALFTGDLSAEQERQVAKQQIGKIDVMKATHHGSNGANAKELLDGTKPDLVIVSCAAKNRYGHPGAEAIERFEACGSFVCYTMQDGQIKITKNNKLIIDTKNKVPSDGTERR